MQNYCKKLEKLLLIYEKELTDGSKEKEELQNKVVEYLKDALEKEQEAEYLYGKMVDLENALNNILVEKVTLGI